MQLMVNLSHMFLNTTASPNNAIMLTSSEVFSEFQVSCDMPLSLVAGSH